MRAPPASRKAHADFATWTQVRELAQTEDLAWSERKQTAGGTVLAKRRSSMRQ